MSLVGIQSRGVYEVAYAGLQCYGLSLGVSVSRRTYDRLGVVSASAICVSCPRPISGQIVKITLTRNSATAEIAHFGGHFTPSRSFKVTNLDSNRKLVCDFILVNNTNLYFILHRFSVIVFQIIASSTRVHLVNAFFLCYLFEYHHISLLKTRFFGYIFLAESIGLPSTTLT